MNPQNYNFVDLDDEFKPHRDFNVGNPRTVLCGVDDTVSRDFDEVELQFDFSRSLLKGWGR
jgi:hypothetical protein